MSPTYRSHCRPGAEAASKKWNPPTGATMSSIYRSRTVSRRFDQENTKKIAPVVCANNWKTPPWAGVSLVELREFEPLTP